MPWCLQSIDWFSNCTWFPRFLCPAKMEPISPSTSREPKIMVVFFQRGINWHWFINSLLGFRCPSFWVYNYQFVKWFQKHELQNVKLALFFDEALLIRDSDAFRRICELRYRVLRRPEKCHPYLTFSSFHGFLSTKYHQGVQSQMTRTIYTTPWK